jgi:hypothetical protein
MHGQCFSFQIHGAQAQNRRVLNGHLGDQIRIWTIAACWLIGTVAVFCSAGTAQTSTVGQWTPVQTWPFMAAHAHLLPNGKVLFWPSFDLGNNPTLWDLVTNAFSPANTAAYNIFCSGHSLRSDGRLLVTGGHNGSSGYGYAYASVFNSTTDTWIQMSDMNDARWYPTNTTLPNGDVLVVSGEVTPGVYNTLPQVASRDEQLEESEQRPIAAAALSDDVCRAQWESVCCGPGPSRAVPQYRRQRCVDICGKF